MTQIINIVRAACWALLWIWRWSTVHTTRHSGAAGIWLMLMVEERSWLLAVEGHPQLEGEGAVLIMVCATVSPFLQVSNKNIIIVS